MPGLTKPIVYEQGDRIYLVAPVSPSSPTESDIEHFAFAADLKKVAPNPNIAWFCGHYVSGDLPNLNGVAWRSGELAIKKLTPMFMPVTVMHDPRTAVGLIADVSMHAAASNGDRARIETALALWKHRFPEVVEEADVNYSRGTLMQSMECLAPDYECSECAAVYHKLPGGAERQNWCEHLLAGAESADARISGSGAFRVLRNVTFTGTGLIFGTRGAEGADPEAHLETFTQEVAEFHQRVHRDTGNVKRRKRAMDDITIPKSEYDELRARPTREDHDKAKDDLAQAQKDLEAAEAAKAKVEVERDAEKAKRETAEEKARTSDLRDERIAGLGAGFVAKLGDKTKERLTKQAGEMSDDDWTARLEELSEAYGVAPDEGKSGDEENPGGKEGEFSKEEVARSQLGGGNAGGGSNGSPAPSARRSVVSGLIKTPAAKS